MDGVVVMKIALMILALLGFLANVYFALFHGSAWAGLGAGLMVAAVFAEPTIQTMGCGQRYDN